MSIGRTRRTEPGPPTPIPDPGEPPPPLPEPIPGPEPEPERAASLLRLAELPRALVERRRRRHRPATVAGGIVRLGRSAAQRG
jgi:hypothetical protein